MSLPKIITVFNDKVVVNEVIFSIPEFKELYDFYNGDISAFQYLWALYDPESPYMNLEDFEREDKVKEDYPGIYNVNDIPMDNAVKKCEALYTSPVRKILFGTKRAIEKLAAYFEDMDIYGGRDGNLSQVNQAIVNMPKIIKAYMEAENAYKQELSRSRGDVRSGIDEDIKDNFDD